MHLSLLLLVLTLVVFASPAGAQGEPLLAWYQIESAGEAELVQAREVTVHAVRGRTKVLVDGREIASRGEVHVEYRGAGDRPDRPRSRTDDGGTTIVRTRIVVYEDGTVETGSWVTKKDGDGKTVSDTKTTTTTTSDGEGGSTSTTSTESTSSGEGSTDSGSQDES